MSEHTMHHAATQSHHGGPAAHEVPIGYSPLGALEAKPAIVGQNLSGDKRQQIEHNFTYHAPRPDQQPKYEQLRSKAKELAHLIVDLTPTSREQSVALTELESCVMWTNAAIARS